MEAKAFFMKKSFGKWETCPDHFGVRTSSPHNSPACNEERILIPEPQVCIKFPPLDLEYPQQFLHGYSA